MNKTNEFETMSDIEYIDYLAEKCLEICDKKNWSRNWKEGGCYLHLEVSEFIEALRGKGDPKAELGDVMFVLLSVMKEYGLTMKDAIDALFEHIGELEKQI